MYKLEFILKNEINKIVWNFEIQTNPLIQARRAIMVLIIKKKK